MKRLKPLALALSLALPLSAAAEDGAPPPAAGAAPAQPPQAMKAPTPASAHLGVAVRPVPPVLAAQLPGDVPRGQGLVITAVEPDSPAARAGLQNYDILLSYDDQRLYSPDQLVALVSADRPGRKVHLKVLRGGRLQEIDVALGAGAPRQMPAPRPMAPWSRPPMAMPHPPVPEQQKPRVREVFEAMSVERKPDGQYEVSIRYRDADGNERSHEFKGSREEISEQIRNAGDLPWPARRQLLNAIGMAERPPLPPYGRPLDLEQLMQLWRQGGWRP